MSRKPGTWYDRIGRFKQKPSVPYKDRNVNLETQAAYLRLRDKEHPEEQIARRSYGSYRFVSGKSTAKRRGHSWLLTKEEHAALLEKPCHYCGGKLNSTGCGLDRLNNDEGYTAANVVPCCSLCNRAKNNMTLMEFEELILRIAARILQGRAGI